MNPLGDASRAGGRRPGVLVIDDNESIRALLGVALGATGFAVWLAADGAAGLTAYRANGPAIDLVLLDVRMPGWDGPRTLAAIRGVAPHVPCCFISGETGEYTEEGLIACGAAAVFHKPFRLGELIPFVRALATSCAPVECGAAAVGPHAAQYAE